ncbi:hypothetical protein Cfla_3345 [Cellulomonas flavigena DSM 20109]|uniref:DUF1648 domain-containing protein n=1 Tax=Cellulomonas flavigena (strain ATCC 482 / DSM 20109 / BCRC 11376 / JCM 18109 / NBRC 3775 / NCIMB 8073 / NRS 134) TaxID=446466 RepID=D5UC65_CELFN|nr:hypothetical protein [Cellulomonas flavigena]ADG76224.1 hypothetical protein Cfla_3345 [Cellulomonas flavigena DSM 20109]
MHHETTTAGDAARELPVRGILVSAFGLLVMAAVSVYAWGQLPWVLTLEDGGKDGADAYVPKLVLVTLPSLLLVGIGAVGVAAQPVRERIARTGVVPLWRTRETDRRSIDTALSILTPVLVAIHAYFLSYATGDERTGRVVLAAAVALVAVVIGNGLPKAPVPDDAQRQALRLDESPELDRLVMTARRGQRRAGPVVLVLGLVAFVLAFVQPTVSLGVSVLAVVAMGAVTGFVVLWSALRRSRA